MHPKSIQSTRRAALLPLLFAALGSLSNAVEIRVATSPSGPLQIGEEVTVELSVANWDPGDPEVDAVAFNVDFDPTVLEFVTGSGAPLADGGEFLALPNQGPGYNYNGVSPSYPGVQPIISGYSPYGMGSGNHG